MSTQVLSATSALQKFSITPSEGLTPQRGYFDWIYDFFGYIGSFVVSSPKKSLSESVESLPSSAMEDVFGRYVGKMSAEVRELEAVDLTNDHDRKGCIKRLFALGIMETHAQKWMQGHTKKYDYSDVTDLFKRANAIRQNILKQSPKGKTYTVSASLKERSVSALSKTSPGIYNGGNNCYLISLFQGILGDPITRRWIVDGTFLVDSPLIDNDVKSDLKRFVTALKKCAFEYEEAQRTSQKKELKFILELREAIDPLITTLTLSNGKQEDPSEVLVQLLQYISPEGNPLFNELTEFSVFKLREGQAGILDRARKDLEGAKVTLEGLSKSLAEDLDPPKHIFTDLKGFLQRIDSKGDYVGLDDNLGVLKAILIVFKSVSEKEAREQIAKAQSEVKRSSYKSESEYQERLKQIANEVTLKLSKNQAQMKEIQETASLSVLLCQVSDEIRVRLNAPKLHDKQWQLDAAIPQTEGLRKVNINGHTQSNAFEEFLAAQFTEKATGGISSPYHMKTDSAVDLDIDKRVARFTTTPQNLFIQLNRNGYSGSSSYKDSKKVHLQDTFFLDPTFTKDGRGGKYQVRWFVVHQGSSDKSGHYVNYRLTEKGWYCHNDTASSPASLKDVEEALETCCLIFATKTSDNLSAQEIEIAIKERIEASQTKTNEERFKEICKDPYHDRRHLSLVHLFNEEISRMNPNLELLKKIYAEADPEFKAFIEKMIVLSEDFAKATPIENQLVLLKGIREAHISTLNGHIVAQYVEVREQRERHNLDAIVRTKVSSSTIEGQLKRVQDLQEALIYESTCIEHVIKLIGAGVNDQDALGFILQIKVPTVWEKVPKAQKPITVENLRPYLEENEAGVKRTIEIQERAQAFGQWLQESREALEKTL